MSRELLDRYVPGWVPMSSLEFRWALGLVNAELRPGLRAARDAVLAEVVEVVPHVSSPEPTPTPTKRRKASPTGQE